MPGAIDQYGRRTVENVASRHLPATALQKVIHRGLRADGRHAPVDGKDGADRHVDVDVGGTIEGVHGHHVFGVVVSGINNLFFFFRNDRAGFTPVFQCAAEADVGNHIEFLLAFALHVLNAHAAGEVDQTRPVYFTMDNFTGQRNVA